MPAQLPKDLVIDIGNSRMKWGLFQGRRIVASGAAAQGGFHSLEAALSGAVPRNIAVGTVAAPDPAFMDRLRRLAPVQELHGGSPSPVRSLYTTRATLGVDRLANVAGAAVLFPGRPVLAIDLGTCATYDLVDALAVHQGGIISPGMRMRARAMHAYSARLPEADPPDDPFLPGTDTTSSIAAGMYHGLRLEVQGYIGHFRQQHPGLAVVLTGGDAPRFAGALKSGIFAHPTLTLIGLHALMHYHPDRGAAVGP